MELHEKKNYCDKIKHNFFTLLKMMDEIIEIKVLRNFSPL